MAKVRRLPPRGIRGERFLISRRARRTSATLGDEFHGRAFRHPAGHALGIPVRKPHAAVRFRLRHLCRLRRAMNPASFRRQADPYRADRVVGAGFDRERLVGMHAFEMIVRIVTIGRIAADLG